MDNTVGKKDDISTDYVEESNVEDFPGERWEDEGGGIPLVSSLENEAEEHNNFHDDS